MSDESRPAAPGPEGADAREATDVPQPWDAFEELSQLTPEELEAILEDLEVFRDRVYWLVRQIPPGRVATYGQIATYAGSPRAARAVGNLMKGSLNRGVTLPWHRVINAKGAISARGDFDRARRQRERLEAEGVVFEGRSCALDVYRWSPNPSFWEDVSDAPTPADDEGSVSDG